MTGDPPVPVDCYPGQVFSSVWYRFTPATSAVYTVSLKDTMGTLWDTVMAIYTSPAACAGPFQVANCNDDSGLGEEVLRSAITQNFDAGTTYYVVVWSTSSLTNPPAVGGTTVQLLVTKPEIPGNDRCVGAEVIPSAGPFPYLTSIQDTYRATVLNDPPAAPCVASNVASRSVWYKFNPSSSGAYYFSTCTNSTKTRVYDTMIAVYTASAGCGSTFTAIACDDDSCIETSNARATLSAGTDYYIVVWDLEPEAQSGETTVQVQVIREGAPLVTTLPVSSLTVTGVVLNGQANPRGLSTRGYFEYGATTNFGSTTPTVILLNGTGYVPFSRLVSGLNPGNTYYYRAVATNSLGTRFGDILSFTVPGQRPRITRWEMLPGGFRMEFTGTAGYANRVLGSDDFVNWTDLGAATSLGGNQFEYVEPNARQRAFRFYRIRL